MKARVVLVYELRMSASCQRLRSTRVVISGPRRLRGNGFGMRFVGSCRTQSQLSRHARQAGGHWFEPSTAHRKSPAEGLFCCSRRRLLARPWQGLARKGANCLGETLTGRSGYRFVEARNGKPQVLKSTPLLRQALTRHQDSRSGRRRSVRAALHALRSRY